MLSFLSVSPEEARRRQSLREAIEAERGCVHGNGDPQRYLIPQLVHHCRIRRWLDRARKNSSLDHFPSLAKTLSNNICLDDENPDGWPVVMFVFREEVYKPDTLELDGRADVIVAEQQVTLKKSTRFSDGSRRVPGGVKPCLERNVLRCRDNNT